MSLDTPPCRPGVSSRLGRPVGGREGAMGSDRGNDRSGGPSQGNRDSDTEVVEMGWDPNPTPFFLPFIVELLYDSGS